MTTPSKAAMDAAREFNAANANGGSFTLATAFDAFAAALAKMGEG